MPQECIAINTATGLLYELVIMHGGIWTTEWMMCGPFDYLAVSIQQLLLSNDHEISYDLDITREFIFVYSCPLWTSVESCIHNLPDNKTFRLNPGKISHNSPWRNEDPSWHRLRFPCVAEPGGCPPQRENYVQGPDPLSRFLLTHPWSSHGCSSDNKKHTCYY